MNRNTADGQLKQVRGSVKEALGKVTGNDRLRAEGASEKVAGKVQEGVGKTQQAASDAIDRVRR